MEDIEVNSRNGDKQISHSLFGHFRWLPGLATAYCSAAQYNKTVKQCNKQSLEINTILDHKYESLYGLSFIIHK